MAHYLKDPSPAATRQQAGHPPDAGFFNVPRLALLPGTEILASIMPKFMARLNEMRSLPPMEQVRPRSRVRLYFARASIRRDLDGGIAAPFAFRRSQG